MTKTATKSASKSATKSDSNSAYKSHKSVVTEALPSPDFRAFTSFPHEKPDVALFRASLRDYPDKENLKRVLQSFYVSQEGDKITILEHVCKMDKFKEEYLAIAKLILQYGGGKYIVHGMGRNSQPIKWAITLKNLALVKLLVANEAWVRHSDFCLLDPENFHVFDFLINDARKLKINDLYEGMSPLARACNCLESKLEIIDFLLRNGAKMELHCRPTNDNYGRRTALCFAAQHGHVDAMTMLIGRGANIHPDTLYSPLWFAINAYQTSSVQILLKARAQVSHEDHQGVSLLNFAVYTLLHTTDLPPPFDGFYADAMRTIIDCLIYEALDDRVDLTDLDTWRASARFAGFQEHTIWDALRKGRDTLACIPILK